jgi:ElaB/YqjD/DUF883 family membrane-anchored ribosome-binding protein
MSSNYPGTSDNLSGQTSSQAQNVYSESESYSSTTSGSALRAELTNLKSDLDALMSKASNLTDRELSDARDKMLSKFSSMRSTAKGMASEAQRQLHQGVDATTDYVKEKPLQSVAIATGIGLLLGAVLRRH